MIRPNKALFWVLLIGALVVVAVLLVRPLRQAFGALIWDPIIVPYYATHPAVVALGGIIVALTVLLLLLVPFILSPLWDAFGLLDALSMRLARGYFSRRFIRYRVDQNPRKDVDPYARLRKTGRQITAPLRFLTPVPIIGDLVELVADDMPSPRVALLLINRIHEASYFAAMQTDKIRSQQRWSAAVTAMQALAAHVLAGPGLSTNTRLIGALVLDELHSQSYVQAARAGLLFPPRTPIWRRDALALYRQIVTELPPNTPWAAWCTLRVLWLELFLTESEKALDVQWAGLSLVEEQFWLMTEIAEATSGEVGTGLALAAANRLAADLVALPALGNSPGTFDLLRFGADVGNWLDMASERLRATVWHATPSSRASELPPGIFLAGQLIDGIGPKWIKADDPTGKTPGDAIRAQLIAARSAVYALIQGGWQGMTAQENEEELAQTQQFAQRAAEEIEIVDDFGVKQA